MFRAFIRLLLRILFRVQVRGELPKGNSGRLLIIANHQSFIDPVLLWAFLPYRPTWVVHSQIWANPWIRFVIRWLPTVVVDTARPQAIKTLVKEIEKGHPVAIFPEGRITITGALMKIYEGPAFLAAKTGAQILPVSVDGAVYTPFARTKYPFPALTFPRIRLTVHSLEHIPMPEGRTGKIRRHIASRQMQRLMEHMRYASRERTTIPDAVFDAVELYGRGAVIVDDVLREGQTYGHLMKAAFALGRLCARLSRDNEIVGILLPNAGTTLSLIIGMMFHRRIPAMLNYSAGVDGMQTACVAARIRTILTSRAFLEKARLTEKIRQLSGVQLVYLEDLRPQFTLLDKVWLIGWALRFPRLAACKSRPDDPAVVLFTSGSEGKPKGVVLSHDAIMANIAQAKAIIDFSNHDKFLTVLPIFHAFGLTCGALLPLVNGCRIYLYPSPLHYRMIPEVAYDRDCTVLLGTPAFLAKYGQVAHPYDFHKMRYIIAGAEKLPEEVRRLWLDKFGIRLLDGYGATETAPLLAANRPMAYKAGTVGMLVPGVESRLAPVPGIEKGGALHVRGVNIMLGYLRHTNPGILEPPESSEGRGWYDTGDVVEIDDEGFVRITARLKRFAKVAGEMVSLEVAEKIATAASPNRLSATSTRHVAGRGELVVLFTQDPDLRRSQLLAAARELGLPELAVARRIEHLDKIPLLGSGKVDYVKLKAMAEALTE